MTQPEQTYPQRRKFTVTFEVDLDDADDARDFQNEIDAALTMQAVDNLDIESEVI